MIKAGRPINQARIELIMKMVSNGDNLTKIGKSLGITRQAVSQLYNKYKANFTKEKPFSTEEVKNSG